MPSYVWPVVVSLNCIIILSLVLRALHIACHSSALIYIPTTMKKCSFSLTSSQAFDVCVIGGSHFNSPDAPQLMNGLKKMVYIHSRVLLSHKKE
jgi:hypothetical protein